MYHYTLHATWIITTDITLLYIFILDNRESIGTKQTQDKYSKSMPAVDFLDYVSTECFNQTKAIDLKPPFAYRYDNDLKQRLKPKTL